MSQTTSSCSANKRPHRKYDLAFRKSPVEQMPNGRPVGETIRRFIAQQAIARV